VRLKNVETGHTPEAKQLLAEQEATVGHLDGIDLLAAYRPDLFGDPFMRTTAGILTGESEWTVGERELFAAFVSAQNQCPF
jgi:hypothetical protein